MKTVRINDEQSAKRLDAVALNELPSLSRSSVQKLIEQGKILVNGSQEKTGYKLKIADRITIDFDVQELAIIPEIQLPIIYEDADCIALDKPVGILTHSKGVFNPEATVASFIANKVTDMSSERAGIVHRLDRATSGVIICAKNQAAQSWLQKQFAQRKTKKTYLAVIKNGIEPNNAVIDMPIERDPSHPKQFRVGASGKSAQTAYKLLQENNDHALLELKPVTGRTHQLRVHLRQLGYPIVGDQLYGGEQSERLMLHAKSLELTLPNRERKVFKSKVPDVFNNITK